MNITDEARDLLKKILSEHDCSGIRIYFAGYGWGGPQMGMALEEPKENDEIQTINGIQVAIEAMLLEELEELTVAYDKERDAIVLHAPEDDCA